MRLRLLSNVFTECAVRSLLLTPGNNPCPGSDGGGLSYVANDIVVATFFMVPRWRQYRYVLRLVMCVPLLLRAVCRWVSLVCVSSIPLRLFQ